METHRPLSSRSPFQKYAEKFDFVAYADRIQALDLDRTLLPASSPTYKQLNEALRASLWPDRSEC